MNTLKRLAILALFITGFSGCASYEGPASAGPVPYDYYYYPSAGVYFNAHSGYYDYYSDGRWTHSMALPPEIHLSPRDRHHFQSAEVEPFRHDHEFRERFSPIPDLRSDRDQDRQARDFDRRAHEQFDNDHGRRR